MGSEVYSGFCELIDLDIDNNYCDPLCTYVFGTILDGPVECEDNNGTVNPQVSEVGFMDYLYVNQALAMEYGVKIRDVSSLKSRWNAALNELDHALISQETIREIGPVSNPNFMLIEYLGISYPWRKKGISVQILKGIIRQMKGKCGYLVILNPTPVSPGHYLEHIYESRGVDLSGLVINPVTAQQKLNAFFRRCGFRTLKKYGDVFVCNVDQVTALPPKTISGKKK